MPGFEWSSGQITFALSTAVQQKQSFVSANQQIHTWKQEFSTSSNVN